MFKKENRLSSRFEFNTTRKYGEYFDSEYFHMYILRPKNYSGSCKFGIVTSNKLHKSAVKRNRVKRVFREVIRNNIGKFDENTWVVVHPKAESLDLNYEEINTEFNKILQKAFVSK